MAFEIRLADQGPVYGGGHPVVCRFTDDEWWNLLSLAHECGFDPGEEHVPVVYPAEEGGANELDGRLHFRWASTPSYARDREPVEARAAIDNSDFALGKVDLQRLLECLGKTRVLVARVEDPGTA
ncbi:hypothetical protein BH24ACT21_BH24ACT21_05980 [soil metagenome]|jgi:hypothetical protein